MHFTKMHGIGNDYVYVDCYKEKITDPARVAKIISDRHFGIGSDGLILIKPTTAADIEMEMYNADGSLGKMCGNGIRCVAKYAYDHGLIKKEKITVKTAAGIKDLEIQASAGIAELIRVNMGKAIFQADLIPVDITKIAANHKTDKTEICLNMSLSVANKEWLINCISMGNPHCVIFTEQVKNFPLEKYGPYFENHPIFPERVNTEFVNLIGRHELEMRVWERGTGETLACGTGACAAAVIAIMNKLAESPIKIHLPGGDLTIEWEGKESDVFMTGTATEVFQGDIEI